MKSIHKFQLMLQYALRSPVLVVDDERKKLKFFFLNYVTQLLQKFLISKFQMVPIPYKTLLKTLWKLAYFV